MCDYLFDSNFNIFFNWSTDMCGEDEMKREVDFLRNIIPFFRKVWLGGMQHNARTSFTLIKRLWCRWDKSNIFIDVSCVFIPKARIYTKILNGMKNFSLESYHEGEMENHSFYSHFTSPQILQQTYNWCMVQLEASQ